MVSCFVTLLISALLMSIYPSLTRYIRKLIYPIIYCVLIQFQTFFKMGPFFAHPERVRYLEYRVFITLPSLLDCTVIHDVYIDIVCLKIGRVYVHVTHGYVTAPKTESIKVVLCNHWNCYWSFSVTQRLVRCIQQHNFGAI